MRRRGRPAQTGHRQPWLGKRDAEPVAHRNNDRESKEGRAAMLRNGEHAPAAAAVVFGSFDFVLGHRGASGLGSTVAESHVEAKERLSDIHCGAIAYRPDGTKGLSLCLPIPVKLALHREEHMTPASEEFRWGSRKTIRRGSAKPGSVANSNDLIFNYRSTSPSWYRQTDEVDAA